MCRWRNAMVSRALEIARRAKHDSRSTKVGSLTESPLTVAFDVPKLGAGIAFMIGDVTGGGTTWSGLTEDFEITDAINGRGTGASLKFNTAQTALSVSATTTITGRGMLVGASWR